MSELTSYFRIAANQPGPVHKIELRSLSPDWKNRVIDKKTNKNSLSNAGFTAVILGVSTGSPDPQSVTTGEELDSSIHRAVHSGAKNIIVCNNFAPYQFETARIHGVNDSEAYEMVEQRGKNWHKSNASIFEHYNDQAQAHNFGFNVVNWNELRSDPRYHRISPNLHRLYADNGTRGEINFADVIKAYIRSYMARFIVNKATEKDAERLFNKPEDLEKIRKLASIHMEEERNFLSTKRDNAELYYGKFFVPSNDFLAHLNKKAMKDLVNSAVEKVTGYAIMSDTLAKHLNPGEKIAYIHHGGLLYWEEFFATHSEIVDELELGSGLNKIAYFTASSSKYARLRQDVGASSGVKKSGHKPEGPPLLRAS